MPGNKKKWRRSEGGHLVTTGGRFLSGLILLFRYSVASLSAVSLLLVQHNTHAAENVFYDDFDGGPLFATPQFGGDSTPNNGWTYSWITNTPDPYLFVTNMTDSTQNNGWGYVTLTKYFDSGETLDDFEAQFRWAYDSLNGGVQNRAAMQSIAIELINASGNRVVSMGLNDAWVGSWGNLYSEIQGNTVDTGGAGTAPSNVSLDVTVSRTSGIASVVTASGIQQLNVPSTTPIAGVALRFGHYNYSGSGGTSFFGHEWIYEGRVTKDPTTRVSTASDGAQANDDSEDPAISANGRYVVFVSSANNLVPGGSNGNSHIYLKDTQNGAVTLVSADSGGILGDASSAFPDISADGRYVAFTSVATNLVPGGSSGQHIFVKDSQTGMVTQVSTDSGGMEGNGPSSNPAISTDGRYVAFESRATNLVPGGSSGNWSIFLKDTNTGTMTKVSADSSGVEGNNHAYKPALSADGRYVAFYSQATNLVPGGSNGNYHIYLKDTQNGAVTQVSTDSTGTEGDYHSFNPAVSADGRYVAFYSQATNLVPGGSNGNGHIFLKDILTGAVSVLSTDSSGTMGNNFSFEPTLSADGHYVAFKSSATNLVVGDTYSFTDVFRVVNPFYASDTDGDGLTNTDEILVYSTNPGKADTDDDGLTDSYEIAYAFPTDTYTPGADTDPSNADTDGDGDLDGAEVTFRSDPLDNASVVANIVLVNSETAGDLVDTTPAGQAVTSGDGRYVVFESFRSGLVTGDTNGRTDVFIKDTLTGVTTRASTDSTGGEAFLSDSIRPAVSDDATFVAFESGATTLVANDTNGADDIFIKNTATGVTARVSTDSAGLEANGYSARPGISANGRYVVFQSLADNLVANDTNGVSDIFIKNTATGVTARVSTDSSGQESTTGGYEPSISGDGRFVSFVSSGNLAGGCSGQHVYLKDTVSGATQCITTDSNGTPGNGGGRYHSINADGRYVVFYSLSDNLVAGDTNGTMDAFVKDTLSGVTTRVSTDSAGVEGNSGSGSSGPGSRPPGISADGRYVVFESRADNLVAGDTNNARDIFVKDRFTGMTVRLSTGGAGVEGNSGGLFPGISPDGRYVVFESIYNLVTYSPGGSNVFRAANQAWAPDTDGDGLSDIDESLLGTDPSNVDTDADGLVDGAGSIVSVAAYPEGVDVDGDGFVDGEQDYGTDPAVHDTDGDGVPDGDEVGLYGIDPNFSNLGDVAPRNSPDNQVNLADLVVLVQLVLGSTTPTSLESVLGDIDTDTQLGVPDLLLLQQAVLSGAAP